MVTLKVIDDQICEDDGVEMPKKQHGRGTFSVRARISMPPRRLLHAPDRPGGVWYDFYVISILRLFLSPFDPGARQNFSMPPWRSASSIRSACDVVVVDHKLRLSLLSRKLKQLSTCLVSHGVAWI